MEGCGNLVGQVSKFYISSSSGSINFSKVQKPSQNSVQQNGDVKQVLYWRPANGICHHTTCNYLGKHVPVTCAPLIISLKRFMLFSVEEYVVLVILKFFLFVCMLNFF